MAQRKGFKDVYVAEVDYNPLTDTYTAKKPVMLFNAKSGKTKIRYEVSDEYADDKLISRDKEFQNGEIEIEGINITPENLELIYGHKYIDGMTVIREDDPIKYVAVGFRSKNTNKKYHFYWYYLVNFNGDEELDFETIAEKSKKQIIKLKGEILARPDGNIGVDIDESALTGSNAAAKALLEKDQSTQIIKWFTAVPEPLTSTI